MRIGIVGGGAAGLICAWLLESDHDVTLFESAPIPGGHAVSHAVTLDGVTHQISPAFHFISHKLQPSLLRLLDQIGVNTTSYRMTCTFYDAAGTRAVALPPSPDWPRARTLFTSGTLANLMHFAGVLHLAGGLDLERDSAETLEQFVARKKFPDPFVREFLYPFIASNWGVVDADARRLSAPNALLYVYRNRGLNPQWLDVNGGMGEYTRTLHAACTRATIHLGRAVRSVRMHEQGGDVVDDGGVSHAFDQIIVATNVETVRTILDGPSTKPFLDAFAGVQYFDTKIAIHGDTSVMPRSRALWSVVNLRREETACTNHHWAGHRTGVPVFRSWVTHASRPVTPVYAEFAYRHPMPTPAYFAAQRALAPLQGCHGLWFAGMHTTGYDNHESAVQSAVRIARRLAPDSARLRALDVAPA